MPKLLEKAFISDRAGLSIVDFLADEVNLSKAKIKTCVSKGGVWVKRVDEDPERLHDTKFIVKTDDEIHIYYDEDLLSYKPQNLEIVADRGQYSIWSIPEGLMTEVSLYSDHLSFEAALERSVPLERDCYLLIPETPLPNSIILVAHSRSMAAKLSALEDQMLVGRDMVLRLYGRSKALISDLRQLDVGENMREEACLDVHTVIFKQAQFYEQALFEMIEQWQDASDSNDYADRVDVIYSSLTFTCPMTGESQHFAI